MEAVPLRLALALFIVLTIPTAAAVHGNALAREEAALAGLAEALPLDVHADLNAWEAHVASTARAAVAGPALPDLAPPVPLPGWAPVPTLAATLPVLRNDPPPDGGVRVWGGRTTEVHAAHAPAREPVVPPEVAVLVPATAALGAAALAVGVGPLLRKLGLVAGFTRITRAALLDHATRARLHDIVRERPGAALGELARHVGVSRTVALHHLHALERAGLLVSERAGRRRLFFVAGGRDATAAALATPTARAVAAQVVAHPGTDQQGLCARLALSPSLAHWHAARLEHAGLVTRVRDGRRVRYFPTAALQGRA